MNILITGGAGFIGQATAKILVNLGHNVTLFDSMNEQIHGSYNEAINKQFFGNLIVGDIRDRKSLSKVLNKDIEILYHFAADTGTGQSMYEIPRYFDVNVQGTANLLSCIQELGAEHSLRKIILSSSRAVYGEGSYHCEEHGLIAPFGRKSDELSQGVFELKCPICRNSIKPVATDESSLLKPTSVYGITKKHQEETLLFLSSMFGIQAIALRYQNVFGPGQSLANPYTGILAIFSNLARKGIDINVFEDGQETRDFVYISDVVDANINCLSLDNNFSGPINVGTGTRVSVAEVAAAIVSYFGNKSNIDISGRFREGDIRHNFADITKGHEILGFYPKVKFSDGLNAFLDWAGTQETRETTSYELSIEELLKRGLLKN